MTFESVVEVKGAWHSPLGGAVFKATPVGKKRQCSFRAARWTISRTPAIGEFWKIKGDVQECSKYGDVIIVKDAFLHKLPSFNYLGNFLKSHSAFRGFYFGKAKIDALLKEVGEYALIGILNKANYLALVDGGLKEPVAQRLCEAWSGIKEETEVATFLSEHKLESSLAKKIVRLCKYNTVARLKRNPYSLLALSNANKRTFRTIFRVATKLGISPNDERALVGCVDYAMYSELDKSNTLVELDFLRELVGITLGWIKSDACQDDAIKLALEHKSICVFESQGVVYLQSLGAAYIEQFVEERLVELQQTPLTSNVFTETESGLLERLEHYNIELEKKEGYPLNQKQKDAVIMALTNRVSVLTGFGGTGKTTCLKAIVDIAKTQLQQVVVAALAGKAANRASQSIGDSAFTIHSLINSIKHKDGLVALDSDPLIILDESSMIDISLICTFLKLFEKRNVRFLFVGDTAQLSPIGFGLFFHRLVETNVAQVRLTETHRQLHGSPLHRIAMSIRNNEVTPLAAFEGQASGVYLLTPEKNAYLSLIELRRDMECVILTPYSSGNFEASTTKLNPSIQSMINRLDETKPSLALGNTIIGVGDPVLATKNKGKEGIFNGMTGIVTAVQLVDNEMAVTILFDGRAKSVELTKDQCWEVGLQLAYAITIHKSQGSEYDVCAIVLGSPFIENSAIYTAVTRTKRLCILVGTQEQYNEAVTRPARYTTIKSGFNPSF